MWYIYIYIRTQKRSLQAGRLPRYIDTLWYMQFVHQLHCITRHYIEWNAVPYNATPYHTTPYIPHKWSTATALLVSQFVPGVRAIAQCHHSPLLQAQHGYVPPLLQAGPLRIADPRNLGIWIENHTAQHHPNTWKKYQFHTSTKNKHLWKARKTWQVTHPGQHNFQQKFFCDPKRTVVDLIYDS